MVQLCRSIANAPLFQNAITMVILFAGLLVGIETYPSMREAYAGPLHVLDVAVLAIFVAEILIKIAAEGARPWRYFLDPWNVFDFVIVAAAFLPFASEYATVLRLLRLLRVLRLVRALPKLQLLVGALLRSIPSMAYVGLLMFLLFYVFAVAGVFLWGENDPIHFKDLQTAMVSLFRTVTLEDWTDMMYINMFGCDEYGYSDMSRCVAPSASPVGAALYFIVFVLFGTMIILNLFIGVILGGMTEAQEEVEKSERLERFIDHAPEGPFAIENEIQAMGERMQEMQEHFERLKALAVAQRKGT